MDDDHDRIEARIWELRLEESARFLWARILMLIEKMGKLNRCFPERFDRKVVLLWKPSVDKVLLEEIERLLGLFSAREVKKEENLSLCGRAKLKWRTFQMIAADHHLVKTFSEKGWEGEEDT